MSAHLIIYTVEMLGIVSCLLMGIGVLLKHANDKTAQIFAALCLSALCFFIKTRQEYALGSADFQLELNLLLLPLKLAMNSFNGFLMILTFRLFQDQKRFPTWLLYTFALQVALEAITVIYFTENMSGVLPASTAGSYFQFNMLPAALQLLFSCCAVYWTLKDWKVDLVRQRRHLRWFFIAFQGCWSFAVTFSYKFLVSQDDGNAYFIHYLIVLFKASFAFVLALTLLRFDFSLLSSFASTRSLATVSKDSQDNADSTSQEPGQERDWSRFNELFIGQKLYLETGLSIASLALKLSIPEYRLRYLINQKLGYRNFNSMLHEYRVTEACLMLADPEQAALPILSIALSIGYQSINPFNKAFRDIKGLTPSDFRKQANKAH